MELLRILIVEKRPAGSTMTIKISSKPLYLSVVIVKSSVQEAKAALEGYSISHSSTFT